MLTRRHLTQTVARALAVPTVLRPLASHAALPVPPSASIQCRVMRKGDDIGLASYRFERSGEVLTVQINIDLRVRLGPIALFRYVHQNVEVWQADTLMSLDAKTDDDGLPKYMSAKRGPEGLMVTGSKTEPYIAPQNALGTTYWNIRCVSTPLINTEDGHLMDVKITPDGISAVPLASGATVQARQYDMRGEIRIDLWYEPTDEFASMRYYAKDGSVVTYARL